MSSQVILLQVMWSRLLSIVEEQAQTLIRTSFSVTTREGGDVSAGLFDTRGRMLAQAETGTPGHINSMAMSIPHFLRRYPVESMKPGDVFLTNDPWKGTGHLHDFTFVTPAFAADRVIAFLACTSHVVDIGGVGFSPEGRQIYHEGLQIPIMRFASGGTVNEWLLEIVRANVREPVQVIGDLYALAACNDKAAQSLQRLMSDTRTSALDEVAEFIIGNSRKAMLDALAQLPKSTARHAMRTDGYDVPVDLVCSVEIRGDGVVVDFDGTSQVSDVGINCPLCYSTAYTAFAVKCVVAPRIPNNHGSLETIVVKAPENSIVNALFPCAVAVRSVVGHLLPDVVFGCLDKILPARAPAEGAGSLWGLKAGAGHGLTPDSGRATPFMMMSLHSGGMGARPAADGLSATPFPSGVKCIPVEITEAITPLIVWKKELRRDSGGIGQYRGGLGQTMIIGNREPSAFTIFATFDRVTYPARGRHGGGNGAQGAVTLGSGKVLKAKGRQIVPAGDTVVLDMPGGAGYGEPSRRDLERIAADLREGYVSADTACRDYRLTLDPEGRLLRSDAEVQ
jgi:N-methylhydantoinase B